LENKSYHSKEKSRLKYSTNGVYTPCWHNKQFTSIADIEQRCPTCQLPHVTIGHLVCDYSKILKIKITIFQNFELHFELQLKEDAWYKKFCLIYQFTSINCILLKQKLVINSITNVVDKKWMDLSLESYKLECKKRIIKIHYCRCKCCFLFS